MSQRLINLVCIIFTLAAAVYLFVFTRAYSMSGSTVAVDSAWDELIRVPMPDDVMSGPVPYSRPDATRLKTLEPARSRGQVEPAPQSLDSD
jgi:hypothetical protein